MLGAASYDDTGTQVQIAATVFAPEHGTVVNVRVARPVSEDQALVNEMARMLRDEGAGPRLPSG